MRRSGFTVLEAVVALSILSLATVGVAQLAAWASTERARAEARTEAAELAANVLEEARTRPWSDLTPEWAKSKPIPEGVFPRLAIAKLIVTVEAEPERPRVKRVTVTIAWPDEASRQPVVLVGLFASRSGGEK